ncbi:MAG TPA: MFS transporter [Pseudolabrys sp.]|nr:MFS transporter [Pseudolabrys sp.]
MPQTRWSMLALLFLARTAMGLQFQTVGSVGPILVDALAIEYITVGTLIGLYLLPGVFVALPGGLLGERFGAKRVVVAGLVMMAAGGAIMGTSASFPALASGRLLSGTGAVLMNVLLTKMVADWFAGRETATAMAILVTSWPVGIAFGLVGFVPIATLFGWPAVMVLAALVSLACLLAIVGLYRDPPDIAVPARPRFEIKLSSREWFLVSVAGLVWATYNVGYILLVSFLPGHLVKYGFDLSGANALVSWLGWSLIALVPVGGFLADRLGRPDLIMASGFVIAGLAAVVLASGASPAISIFVIVALTVGLPAGPIMTLPAAATGQQNRATGMGIYFTWYYALMAGFPALAGFARDVTSNSGTPILFAGMMMTAALVGLAAFRLLTHSWAARVSEVRRQ